MKYVLRRVSVVLALCAVVFVIWEFLEWHELREEKALDDLRMTNFEIKGATFDEALRRVVEELHARGHPEVQLHIYEDGRQVPYFRAKVQKDGHSPASTIDLRVVPEVTVDGRDVDTMDYHGPDLPGRDNYQSDGSAGGQQVTLHNILWNISYEFQLPCVVRGHNLVAAHTSGTLQRYRHTVIQCGDGLFKKYSDQALLDEIKGSGVTFYADMTIDVRRASKTVEIYGPAEEIKFVDQTLSPHPEPWPEEMKWRLKSWWWQIWNR